MHIVRCLGGGIHGDSIFVFGHGHHRVLLQGEVIAAGVEQRVLEHEVGLVHPGVQITEPQRDLLVGIALGSVVVDSRLGVGQGIVDAADGLQGLIVHLYLQSRFVGCFLRRRGYRGHGVADKPDPVRTQGMLVLGDGENAKGLGHLLRR